MKRLSIALIAGVLSSACASSRLHHDGLEAVEAGNYEEGLGKLEEAARANPSHLEYRVELKARHGDAVVKLLGAADRARGAANLDEAERNFRRVLVIEPGNDRAQRGLDGVAADRRHAAMVARATEDLNRHDLDKAATDLRGVLAENPGYAPASALQAKIDTLRGPITLSPHLKTHDNRPVTLQFRDANTKMVFEVLSRQTGINFVFDKEVKSDGKTTIFVQQVPVEQAIELVLGQNQLARQVLSENMVLIYPNTPAKQKEYQDEIVKTFYLTNTEPKKAQELLKTVLNAKTLFVDDKANLIVIRDTPETVRMAEKLIASLDLAESEVMMEVEVLEITRSDLQQLGINYPTGGTLSTPSLLNLKSIRQLGKSDISVTPLSISLDLLKQVGHTNTLASPRIRARNREKARILIGQREPVITNSNIVTASGAPLQNSSVQYLDVGLTLEVEPTVHLDNVVSIKLNLEVSSIIKQVKNEVSGTIAYEIGTRNAQTLLSLKDGETQILAGLIQDSDTRNSSHIPGLGDIPILGRLFGSNRTDKQKSEIVLSITPRIIRSAARPSSETTEFWYGTESNMRSAPLGAQGGSAGETGGTTREAGAPAVSPAVTQAATVSAYGAAAVVDRSASEVVVTATPTSTPAATAPVLAPPADTSRTQIQSEANAGNDAGPQLSWVAPSQTTVGQEFDVTVHLSSQQALSRITSQLHFDGRLLQLMNADAGDLIPSSVKSTAVPRINQRAGVAQYVVSANKDSPLKGDGGFLVLHFKALARSGSTPIVLQFVATGADGRDVRVGVPAPFAVSISQ